MSVNGVDMTQAELKEYQHRNKKLIRDAQRELKNWKQLESTREPRTAKTKALSGKVWLGEKRPRRPNSPTSTGANVSKTTNKKRKKDKVAAEVKDGDREEEPDINKSGPAAMQPSKQTASKHVVEESDSLSLSEPSNSDESDSGNEFPNVQSLTDEQLAALLGSKDAIVVDGNDTDNTQAHTPAPCSLLDIADEDVKMVSHAPSQASSCASGPPTSDYDGQSGKEIDDDDHEETQADAESDDSEIVIPHRRSEQPKVSAKHQEAKFEREQPKIKEGVPAKLTKTTSDVPKTVKDKKNDADDDSKWLEWTCITFSEGARSKPKLLKQHAVIHGVVCSAIKLAEIDVITKKAWPKLETSCEVYRRMILLKGAKVYFEEDKKANQKAKEVRERVKGSTTYAAILGDLVMDRLSLLGVGDRCALRIEALKMDDVYIYPGQWQVDKKTKRPIWVIERLLIYQNPGFMDSIKQAFFSSKGDFGFKHLAHFTSSLPKRPEPELTIPLVALAATGFYAALHGWETGKDLHDKEHFEGDSFNLVYECHVKYLKQMKEDNAVAFHVIMSRLYNHATGSAQGGGSTTQSGNALKVADLSGYE